MAVRLLLFCVCIGLIVHVRDVHNITCYLQGQWGSLVSSTIILGVEG